MKVLETRRSCRNFKPDVIKDEELKAIVRAGTYAATGMGKRSPRRKRHPEKRITFITCRHIRKVVGSPAAFFAKLSIET